MVPKKCYLSSRISFSLPSVRPSVCYYLVLQSEQANEVLLAAGGLSAIVSVLGNSTELPLITSASKCLRNMIALATNSGSDDVIGLVSQLLESNSTMIERLGTLELYDNLGKVLSNGIPIGQKTIIFEIIRQLSSVRMPLLILSTPLITFRIPTQSPPQQYDFAIDMQVYV